MNELLGDILRLPLHLCTYRMYMRFRSLTPPTELAGLWIEFVIKSLVTSLSSQGFRLTLSVAALELKRALPTEQCISKYLVLRHRHGDQRCVNSA